jgi:hypothetical protein
LLSQRPVGATSGHQRAGASKDFRIFVSPRQIASLCGHPFTEVDIFEAGDEMGLKGSYNRYGRFEARLIIVKLMARASNPQTLKRLFGAYTRLADLSEPEQMA